MIVYHQAFDLYHTVYRHICILTYFNRNEYVEVERLRIWDYYLLFPNKMDKIKLKQEEKDIKQLIRSFIQRKDNPYEIILDDRKMFEKIRPYQINSIKCLASYGVINKDFLTTNRISTISKDLLEKYSLNFEKLTIQQENAIKLLTSHFYQMPLYGSYGLKERTGLLESRYDA